MGLISDRLELASERRRYYFGQTVTLQGRGKTDLEVTAVNVTWLEGEVEDTPHERVRRLTGSVECVVSEIGEPNDWERVVIDDETFSIEMIKGRTDLTVTYKVVKGAVASRERPAYDARRSR